jgi:hypothetical protein
VNEALHKTADKFISLVRSLPMLYQMLQNSQVVFWSWQDSIERSAALKVLQRSYVEEFNIRNTTL